MAKKTLIQRWQEEGLAPQLAELMKSTVFQREAEIIQEHTEPNDLVIQRVYRTQPAFADQIIASLHKTQAGERRVFRMLRWLSEGQGMPEGQLPEPFSNVDETYFETRNS